MFTVVFVAPLDILNQLGKKLALIQKIRNCFKKKLEINEVLHRSKQFLAKLFCACVCRSKACVVFVVLTCRLISSYPNWSG